MTIDEVVEELELESFKFGKDGFSEKYVRLSDAIEIVKQGCVESDDVCEWKIFDNSVEDDDNIWTYETGCKNYIEEEHTVHFKFCPYCGKKIKVVE